jgi:hypothetical protein
MSPKGLRLNCKEKGLTYLTMNDIQRLAEELTRLANFVPATKEELNQWYAQAQRLIDSRLLTDAPHFVWHYLSDADIRMKDEVYAEMQNRRINLVLTHLNCGVMPTDKDV